MKNKIMKCEICHEQIEERKEKYYHTKRLCGRCYNQEKEKKSTKYKGINYVRWVKDTMNSLKGGEIQ